MGNSASTSSGLAKGKNFTDKFLYVQHLDKDRETASEISELCIEEFLLAHRYNFDDPIFMKYLNSPNENLSMLKWSLMDSYARIKKVTVYSNPLSSTVPSLPENGVTIHAFVVFKMRHHYLFQPWEPSEKKPWFEEEKEGILETIWWSLEKNGKYIVLQQSPNKNDVIKKIYDTEKKTSVERLGPIEKQKNYFQSGKRDGRAEDLFRVIWNYYQFSEPYNLWTSNCQNFASFIFEKSTGKKWSAPSSSAAAIFTPENKEIQPGIKVDARKYTSIIDDLNFDFYRAMIEGRREDFVELYNLRCHNLPDELRVDFLNDVDSQGNTLLEWGTAFSSSHWLIDEELKEKGAEIPSDEGSFRRNVFFIALQYLPNTKNPKLSDSSDGVNKTGDNTALPYLYGEKWNIVEKILNQFEDDDYNTANSLGETALILAAEFKCEDKLFTKILQRTNPENINAQSGFTALHWAIDEKSETKVKELLNHNDVDFSVKNFYDHTPLHWACLLWKDIPADLFKIILEKSTDVINAKDKYGDTALHCAISGESEIATKELLKHSDVNVDKKNKDHETALSYALKWKDIPPDLFYLILEKSTSYTINAQDKDGETALHLAISRECEIATRELLAHNDVNVNVKNNDNQTALHFASRWKDIPMNLFKIILKKSTDINAQDNEGWTALHHAIWKKSEIATKELLAHKDVNVNIKNDTYQTALSYISMWEDIPSDLFNLISERKANKVKKISKMDRLFKYLRNLTVSHK